MMFGKSKNAKPQNRIDSLIGAGTRIDGNIRFSGGLRIDGEVVVSHLMVNGTIVGPVRVKEVLELQPCARVTGDVEYMQLEMQPGAVVQGRLIHQTESKGADLKLAAVTRS
jgi:cytoskeletal protein CcmA (bactofilin family)